MASKRRELYSIAPLGSGPTTRLATKLLLAGLGNNALNLLSYEDFYIQNVTRYFEKVGQCGNYYDLVEHLDFTPWQEDFAEGSWTSCCGCRS